MTPERARALLRDVVRARVLVVGDLMLDEHQLGRTIRTCHESNCPVVEIGAIRTYAGAAANVACNVASLGASAILIGSVGADTEGARLLDLLRATPRLDLVPLDDPGRPTTRKSRVEVDGRPFARLDRESRLPLQGLALQTLRTAFTAALEEPPGCVILSDYDKGVLPAHVLPELIGQCRARAVPCLVDPKKRDLSPYRGATLLKPNRRELENALSARSDAPSLQTLLSELDGAQLLLTDGAAGMQLHRLHGAPLAYPAHRTTVADVIGAGDTAIATLGVLLAVGAALTEAISLATVAAAIAVGKPGTATLTADEVLSTLALGA